MRAEEQQAFQLARKVVQQAADEQWSYICLSPFYQGDSGLRPGFEVFKHLTTLPDEIRQLKSGIIIEVRGTSIADLRPLAHVDGLGLVNFAGIPAAQIDQELEKISATIDIELRKQQLGDWLDANRISDPPEVIEGGPEFVVDDFGPIKLVDPPLVESDDADQRELQEECRRKAAELLRIVELAANISPDLPATAQRYSDLIDGNPSLIGARRIWSVANSLEAALDVHNGAVENDRPSEELPATIASKLADLAETHRVWFLGHPGARDVELRANRHAKRVDSRERRNAAILVVEAAEASSAVANDATAPARENIHTSVLDTPAGVAALGELEEWTWNFIASVVRKAWRLAKDPPGGFVSQTVAGHYLIMFLVSNDEVIRQYLQNIMSQGPLWWEALSNSLRRGGKLPDEQS